MSPKKSCKIPCNSEIKLDRITHLPIHIIEHILSYLPIQDAVRTSILSSKWRYKWATIPTLIFDDEYHPLSGGREGIWNKLVSIINHVLLLHNGEIHKFKLSLREVLETSDIDRWILRISRSSIKGFILDIWNQRYKIPSSLFFCKNLTHLELFNCLLMPPSSFKGLPNLKNLDLQHVTLTQDAFENLISSCPLLERLTLMHFDGFDHLKINAPKLMFFDVGGAFEEVTFENAFQLSDVSISLRGTIKMELKSTESSTSNMEKFFEHLPCIQRLQLQGIFLKYLALGDIPRRLSIVCADLNYLSLRINFNDPKESEAALCLFRSSPNIVELEMLMTARPNDKVTTKTLRFWTEVDYWEYPLQQLRVLKIVGISGASAELDFIELVLANSPLLEKMTVKPASMDGGWRLLKELIRFRRSVRAEIICLDP